MDDGVWSLASPRKGVTFDFFNVSRRNVEEVSGCQIVNANGIRASTFHAPRVIALPSLANAQRGRSQQNSVVFSEYCNSGLHVPTSNTTQQCEQGRRETQNRAEVTTASFKLMPNRDNRASFFSVLHRAEEHNVAAPSQMQIVFGA
jgi:hypothetical protein